METLLVAFGDGCIAIAPHAVKFDDGSVGACVSLVDTGEVHPVGSAVYDCDLDDLPDACDVVLLFKNPESAEVLIGQIQAAADYLREAQERKVEVQVGD